MPGGHVCWEACMLGECVCPGGVHGEGGMCGKGGDA